MNIKVIVGLLVMAAWGAFVVMHMTPIAPFIDALRDILYGVCIYHVSTTKGSPQ